MSCNQTPCTCTDPCAPTPCTDGCLLDVATNCVPLSSDIVVASTTIPKGTSLTSALDTITSAVNGTITISSTDIKTKISSSDTTSDYLTNKVVGSTSIAKSILNPAGNEQIKLDIIRDTVTGGGNNALVVSSNGVYVAPSSGGAVTTLAPAADTNTFHPIVNSISGGYTISGDVKIDTVTGGNILASGTNGLYVPAYTPSPSLSVSPVDTSSIDTNVNLVGSTYQVSSNLRIDPSSTATVSVTSAGLKVDSATSGGTTITVTDSTSIDHTLTPITGGYNITSEIIVAPGTNALYSTASGLYVAPPVLSFGVLDTNSINMTLTGSTITSDLVYQDSNTIDLSVPDASGLKADIKLDTVTGGGNNALSSGPNGLYASFAISGTCSALTISDVTFDLVQDLNGEVYLRTTPVTNVSFDTIRLNIAYTKAGGGTINTNVSDIVNRKVAGVPALSYTLLPNFDYNNAQTVTINAAKQCSALNTTAVSADYTTTVGWTGNTIALDTWINIPAAWYGANCTAGTFQPQYKISKDRKNVYFRGTINTTSTLAQIPTGGFTSFTEMPLIQFTTGTPTLASLVSPSVNLYGYGVVTHSLNDDTSTVSTKLSLTTVAGGTGMHVRVEGTNTSGSTYQVTDIYIGGISLH